MRSNFVEAVIRFCCPKQVFLTGDLGYNALEPVRACFAERFINAGVAEQNMIGLAAGLAHEGFLPWVYSITPFLLLRPYEQIRNDIAYHQLPVKLVGNGGGYGYGIMGATHHALEDLALMRSLPGMAIFIPLWEEDVSACVQEMLRLPQPAYLRLNQVPPSAFSLQQPFQTWRNIQQGDKLLVLGVGTVLHGLNVLPPHLLKALDIWVLGRLPWGEFSAALLDRLKSLKKILILEEHNSCGGIGELVAAEFLKNNIALNAFYSATAQGYPDGKYGSQYWHQIQSGLAGKKLEDILTKILM